MHASPPQSVSDSVAFFTPSVHVAGAHFWDTQSELGQ
jgi:hypothetical protein